MFRLSSGSHRSHKTMTPPHAVFPMVPRHGKHSPAQKSSLHLEKAVEGLATCSLNVSSLTVNYVHVAENILSFSRIKGYFWFNTFYFLCILNDCSMAFHVFMALPSLKFISLSPLRCFLTLLPSPSPPLCSVW